MHSAKRAGREKGAEKVRERAHREGCPTTLLVSIFRPDRPSWHVLVSQREQTRNDSNNLVHAQPVVGNISSLLHVVLRDRLNSRPHHRTARLLGIAHCACMHASYVQPKICASVCPKMFSLSNREEKLPTARLAHHATPLYTHQTVLSAGDLSHVLVHHLLVETVTQVHAHVRYCYQPSSAMNTEKVFSADFEFAGRKEGVHSSG